MAKLKKVYDDADNNHVANYIAYMKYDETDEEYYMYYDEACTEVVKVSDALDAFTKGRLLVFYDNVYRIPCCISAGTLDVIVPTPQWDGPLTYMNAKIAMDE